jgi:thymidylate synthase
MTSFRVNNVNDALRRGVDFFGSDVNYRRQESRNGSTLEALEPVITTYLKPWERVLLFPARDANPFFHLVEAIWMMAGANHVGQLLHFNAGMRQYSDDGQTLHGAYGYRWYHQFGHNDQIVQVISLLKNDPESRRAVLQMWDPIVDLGSPSRDVPCNTSIFFKVRDDKLQMTVCNRSNDMVWGAYGANAVHMSVLQEFIAKSLDVGMGPYHQISDCFHVYENKQWEMLRHTHLPNLSYPTEQVPVVHDASTFYVDCLMFLRAIPIGGPLTLDFERGPSWMLFKNPIFWKVLRPMVKAFIHHKQREYTQAYESIRQIEAEDWQEASFNWIKKRQLNYEGSYVN